MGSLYQRALALRKKIDRDIENLEMSLGDEIEQWITPEERRKIFVELDGVSTGSTIQDKPGKLSFTPERNDRFFPLLFNIAAVVLTAAGILALVVLFSGEARSISRAEDNIMTAEARLFASFREQTEEQLTRKDREIRETQRRLAEMGRERDRLQQEGETLIAERTEQLRAELDRVIEQERQRLASQGLTTTAITTRLSELEQQLARQQQEELEAYKRQVDEQLAEQEAALTELTSKYDQNLLQLQADKDRIEEELQQLESDSEARLQRERETLERERTAVQLQLESLQAQNEKERLVLDQILSGYSRVSSSLQMPDYEQALQQLDVIQSFLSQESVAALPAIQRRRPVELFIIRSLRELIENQQVATSQPTTNLIAAAELLTSVSQTVEQADSAYRSGDADRAKQLYIAAIEKIPKLKQSYPVLRDLERLSLEADVESLQSNIANLQEVINRLESELESQRGETVATAAIDPGILGQIDQLEAQLASANRDLDEERSKLERATERSNENQELLERIRGIDERFGQIAATPKAAHTEDQLLSLLETKLRLKEVLSSGPVRQDHPNLYDNVETYLRVYGQTFENEGRATMLHDVITLLQALAEGKSTDDLFSIVAPYGEEQLQQLLQQFFTVLYVLIE
ncbi:MAG: hypothetical protein JSW34_02575 [Candidatus Zixiibacteriota bacterium]|nr:MAG: hypothetical protein JSW34_02575 [candidate division Zixibacteria bacterium]